MGNMDYNSIYLLEVEMRIRRNYAYKMHSTVFGIYVYIKW